MQVHRLPFIPPEKDVIDMLRVCAEISGKLIVQFCSAWGSKCRQIVKYVSYL
jgi:hypothetical protein